MKGDASYSSFIHLPRQIFIHAPRFFLVLMYFDLVIILYFFPNIFIGILPSTTQLQEFKPSSNFWDNCFPYQSKRFALMSFLDKFIVPLQFSLPTDMVLWSI